MMIRHPPPLPCSIRRSTTTTTTKMRRPPPQHARMACRRAATVHRCHTNLICKMVFIRILVSVPNKEEEEDEMPRIHVFTRRRIGSPWRYSFWGPQHYYSRQNHFISHHPLEHTDSITPQSILLTNHHQYLYLYLPASGIHSIHNHQPFPRCCPYVAWFKN